MIHGLFQICVEIKRSDRLRSEINFLKFVPDGLSALTQTCQRLAVGLVLEIPERQAQTVFRDGILDCGANSITALS